MRHLRVANDTSRCGRRDVEMTFDDMFVVCARCRELGHPYEVAPDKAHRINSFISVSEIKREDKTLNLHNVIFIDGGSLLWFEEPNVFAVMHAKEGGRVRRYEGSWEAQSTPAEVAS